MKEYWENLKQHNELLGAPNERTEGPDNLTLVYFRKKEALVPLLTPFLGEFLTAFGTTIKYLLVDSAGGDDATLSLDRSGFDKGLLKQWIDTLPEGADCKLVVNVSKTQLIKQTFDSIAGRMLMYFYSEPVLATLARDLRAIEEEWFTLNEKFFLVLGDTNCILVGDVLHVLGGVSVGTIRKYIGEPLSDAQKTVLTRRLNTRGAETHWHDGTRFLVPEYLHFQDKSTDEELRLKPKLNKRLLDIAIASIANYSHSEATDLVSVFEGQKRAEIRSTPSGAVSDDVAETWFRIYDWIYRDHTRDKLAIARNLVTLQAYDSSPDTYNYGMITSNPTLLLASAPDLYDKFIGESIKEYFDKLKEASTYVQSKVDSIGQQVSALVDTFIKNLVATAGFLIGTVLSKLIDPDLSRIYPWLVFAFLVYMAVILFVYYPLTWWSYHLTCKEYEHSLQLYERSFTKSDLEKFVGTSFRKRKWYFRIAFLVTLLVHVALIVTGSVLLRVRPF